MQVTEKFNVITSEQTPSMSYRTIAPQRIFLSLLWDDV
jgi:hypothetical protein